jgi:hypothetical protein
MPLLLIGQGSYNLSIACAQEQVNLVDSNAGAIPFEQTGQPLAGSCSAAIAATSHPSEVFDNRGIELGLLQWGAMKVGDGIEHCTFSSHDVGPVDPMIQYSGDAYT